MDDDAKRYIALLRKIASLAASSSVGHAHAKRLAELYGESYDERVDIRELDLARWHQSAYLLGTLELRDHDLLAPLLTPANRNVFKNVANALSFATNRNFLQPLQAIESSELSMEFEQQVAKDIGTWWKNYLNAHPGGDWIPAVVSGFIEAGYKVTIDLRSAETQRELLRALDNDAKHIRYNACRLFNHIHGTTFDIERFFLSDKYALSPFDPSSKSWEYQRRVIDYWKRRLGQ